MITPSTAANASPIIRLRNVSKTYKVGEVEIPALRNVNLEIPPASFVVIVGVSGSGKTTLLNLIGGIDKPTSGQVIVDSEDISKKHPSELVKFRRQKIGFVFQASNLLSTLTVEENVEAGLELLALNHKQIGDRTTRYLLAVGIEDKRNKFPFQLSGGDQQRAAITRALAREPKIVLADEPTGQLDERTGYKIVDLMKIGVIYCGATVLIVTHNEEIAKLADMVVRLKDGQVAEIKKKA